MNTHRVDIVVSGDWMVGDLLDHANENGISDKIVAGMRDVSKLGALSILNVEAPITQRGLPIEKVGPNFRMAPRAAEVIAAGGYDIGLLANNHIGDYGPVACGDTIRHLEAAGVKTVGAGNNKFDALRPLFRDLGSLKLALVAATEHEFGLATDTTAGSAPLHLGRLFHVVAQAKSQADLVIIFIHGGCEYSPIPNPFVRQLYRDLIDAGAHAVIGTHPHVPQGIEEYRGAPCVYSLGDFSFKRPQIRPVSLVRRSIRSLRGRVRSVRSGLPQSIAAKLLRPSPFGISVILRLHRSGVSLQRIIFTRCESDSGHVAIEHDRDGRLRALLEKRCIVLTETERYQKVWNAWCHEVGPNLLRGLRQVSHSLRPTPRLTRSMLLLQNRIGCEAHREVIEGACRIFRPESREEIDKKDLHSLLQGWHA